MRRKIAISFFIILGLALGSVPAEAGEVLVITGDASTLDYGKNVLSVQGHVQLAFKDLKGSCDTLNYLIKEGVVELKQNVVILRGGNKLTGKSARYYVKESKIVIEDEATLIFNPESGKKKK